MSAFDVLKEAIVEVLELPPEKEVTENTNIFVDLGADSLHIAELSMVIEDKFGVTIPESDLTDIVTVRGVRDLINAKLASGS